MEDIDCLWSYGGNVSYNGKLSTQLTCGAIKDCVGEKQNFPTQYHGGRLGTLNFCVGLFDLIILINNYQLITNS